MKELVKQAISEDVASGDITSNATVAENKVAEFKLIAKEDFILCGIELFKQVFAEIDAGVEIICNYCDGANIADQDVILYGSGNARSILKAERVALNFVQYLSSIATQTNKYVKLCEGTNIKILDTRKTVPLYRELAKYAVRVGGGSNHRMGLYDAILIKDNHIAASGGVGRAILAAKSNYPDKVIEIECETIEQLKEAIKYDIDVIMLDNMSNNAIAEAINIIKGKCKIEVSGNITLTRLPSLKILDIDYISLGDITYNTRFCDISLKISVKI